MLSFDEGEEVLFDMREDESFMKEDSAYGDLGYKILLRELKIVKERRESFLKRMDFVGRQSLCKLETMGLERVIQSTGAVLSSYGLCGPSIGDHLVSKREELDGGDNCLSMILTRIEKEEMMIWLKYFVQKMKKNRGNKSSDEAKLVSEAGNMDWTKIEQRKKRFMECNAVCAIQEISAHDGLIWTMKFSPDDQYLASGDEDRMVCIWCVSPLDPFCKTSKYNFGIQEIEGKSSS
ncbi:uncharacterized WD repeat-containing [Olea europaea subsp. europaea]|uniref:Uncharacterized WD repeat-containing n=1 Tax=Olea europaea subsp. europaea TaxID=158383 RepID=A0A8S0RZX8_OLEEU|nr:uncharacterized WD repeat-containing [Olea europaea subsp. europaea]